MEKLDVGVGDGVASFDLARFDTEGCGKGEAVLSVEGEEKEVISRWRMRVKTDGEEWTYL